MSSFTQEELQSDTYRWRKRTLVHIFYQTFQLGKYAGDPDQQKRTVEDQYGSRKDIDSICLKNFFVNNEKSFPGGVKVMEPRHLKSFDETMQILKEMDAANKKAEFEQFDCFFFAFLTFSEADGRLHFDDPDPVPLEKILEVVSGLEVARGKPKIFLIQADDMSLTREKVVTKGPPEKAKKVKIPTDADRLIILSNIPQKIVPDKNREGRVVPYINRVSFLIQAFVEVMEENFGNENKTDLFSLTCKINGKVRNMINGVESAPRKDDLHVPLITSTLAKRLHFQ